MNDVTIVYCRPCGYEKRAREAADAIERVLGVSPRLIAGRGGVFEVRLGEQRIAARTRSGFPRPEEIVQALVAVQRRSTTSGTS